MATWLKQSTAVDIGMGPFLDDGDGKTPETALTITQPDIRLKKNGGAWAQKNAAQTLSHEEFGWYEVALDSTDTNTLGVMIVAIAETGALPVWREFIVVPATVYDSMVLGTDNLPVDAVQIEGADATDTITSSATASLTSYDPPTNAEMVARTLVAADYATASALATVDTAVDTLTADLATVDGVVDAIKAKTDNLPTDPADQSLIIAATSAIAGAIAALNDLSAADVNAEVLDVLSVDTFSEPGQGTPSSTATIVDKLGMLYKALTNRVTQTSSEYALYASDGTTKDQEAAVSDDGTTFERTALTTGA